MLSLLSLELKRNNKKYLYVSHSPPNNAYRTKSIHDLLAEVAQRVALHLKASIKKEILRYSSIMHPLLFV